MAVGSEEANDATFDIEKRRLYLCHLMLAERRIITRYLKQNDWNHATLIMLLELYGATKPLSVSSLSYASGVSQPTAGRLTVDLETRRFIDRETDPRDARRTHVSMTPRGYATMRTILDECGTARNIGR